jgi:hypothetical protein
MHFPTLLYPIVRERPRMRGAVLGNKKGLVWGGFGGLWTVDCGVEEGIGR